MDQEQALKLIKGTPQDIKLKALYKLTELIDGFLTEEYIVNDLTDLNDLVGIDVLSQLNEIESDSYKVNSILDSFLLEISNYQDLAGIFDEAKKEEDKLCDPFSFMLGSASLLYIFSIKWDYNPEDGFSASFPGLKSKEIKELLVKLFKQNNLNE